MCSYSCLMLVALLQRALVRSSCVSPSLLCTSIIMPQTCEDFACEFHYHKLPGTVLGHTQSACCECPTGYAVADGGICKQTCETWSNQPENQCPDNYGLYEDRRASPSYGDTTSSIREYCCAPVSCRRLHTVPLICKL